MALIAAKCSSCGGDIKVDDTREKGYCPFCGTEYYEEKIINNTYITNNYAGANVYVQAADIENYIKVIRNHIDKKEYDDAKKVIGDAIVHDPDNEKLLFLKLMLAFRCMESEVYDMCGIDNNVSADSNYLKRYYDNIQNSSDNNRPYSKVKIIGYKSLFDEFDSFISQIHGTDIIDQSFELAISTLINIFLPIYKTERLFLSNKEIYGLTKEEQNNLYKIMGTNKVPIYGYLINLFSDARISNSVMNNGLVALIAQYNSLPPDERWSAALIGSSGFSSQYFVYSKYPKPQIMVKQKHGQMNTANKFGNYLVHFIRQSHPGFDSEALREIERLSDEQDLGCYVATCVYGSYDCPQVWTLRRYRDYSLTKTWYGRAFIHVYYAISPTIVRWFGETEWFKNMWRGKLDSMVNKLHKAGYEDTPYMDRIW